MFRLYYTSNRLPYDTVHATCSWEFFGDSIRAKCADAMRVMRFVKRVLTVGQSYLQIMIHRGRRYHHYADSLPSRIETWSSSAAGVLCDSAEFTPKGPDRGQKRHGFYCRQTRKQEAQLQDCESHHALR